MNYRELKELERKACRTKGKEREKLVQKLVEEAPKLDPFEGFDPIAVLLARKIAWMKRLTDSFI